MDCAYTTRIQMEQGEHLASLVEVEFPELTKNIRNALMDVSSYTLGVYTPILFEGAVRIKANHDHIENLNK